MKVKIFDEKGKRGYQQLASRLYDEVHELNKQLAAVSSAHTITLQTSLKQAKEIELLTFKLGEAQKQLGTTHEGVVEVQDQEEAAPA